MAAAISPTVPKSHGYPQRVAEMPTPEPHESHGGEEPRCNGSPAAAPCVPHQPTSLPSLTEGESAILFIFFLITVINVIFHLPCPPEAAADGDTQIPGCRKPAPLHPHCSGSLSHRHPRQLQHSTSESRGSHTPLPWPPVFSLRGSKSPAVDLRDAVGRTPEGHPQ